MRRRATASAILALSLCALGTSWAASPSPAAGFTGPVRLASHNHSAAEVLVYAERQNLRFVTALLDALAEVNAERDRLGSARVGLLGVYKPPGQGLGLLQRWGDRVPLGFLGADSRMDVWLQDVAEIGWSADGLPALVGSGRGRALDRLMPELARRWNGSWAPLSAPAAGVANGAGNVEALPFGLVMLGSSAGPDLRRFLARQGYAESIVELDTGWLAVGHVDEIVSHVVLNVGECGMALLRASPATALALLERSPSELEKMQRHARRDSARFRALQVALEARLQSAEATLTAALARRRPACAGLRVIRLPVAFGCRGTEREPRECRALTPNVVNLLVVDRTVIVPDPGIDSFRRQVDAALRSAGQTPRFIDTRFYARRQGGAHCATNVRRRPDVVLNLQLETDFPAAAYPPTSPGVSVSPRSDP